MSEMIPHTYSIPIKEHDDQDLGKSLSIDKKGLIEALQNHIYQNMQEQLLPTKNGEEKKSYIEFKNGQGPAYRLDLHFTYVQERGQGAKVKIQGGDNRDYIIGTVNPNPQYNLDNPKDIKNSSGLPFDTSLLQMKRVGDGMVMPLIVSHPPKKYFIKDNIVKFRDFITSTIRGIVAPLFAIMSNAGKRNKSIMSPLDKKKANEAKREAVEKSLSPKVQAEMRIGYDHRNSHNSDNLMNHSSGTPPSSNGTKRQSQNGTRPGFNTGNGAQTDPLAKKYDGANKKQ